MDGTYVFLGGIGLYLFSFLYYIGGFLYLRKQVMSLPPLEKGISLLPWAMVILGVIDILFIILFLVYVKRLKQNRPLFNGLLLPTAIMKVLGIGAILVAGTTMRLPGFA